MGYLSEDLNFSFASFFPRNHHLLRKGKPDSSDIPNRDGRDIPPIQNDNCTISNHEKKAMDWMVIDFSMSSDFSTRQAELQTACNSIRQIAFLCGSFQKRVLLAIPRPRTNFNGRLRVHEVKNSELWPRTIKCLLVVGESLLGAPA
jgi:tetrahydromethanopterin S-methyltransferase subunit F